MNKNMCIVIGIYIVKQFMVFNQRELVANI